MNLEQTEEDRRSMEEALERARASRGRDVFGVVEADPRAPREPTSDEMRAAIAGMEPSTDYEDGRDAYPGQPNGPADESEHAPATPPPAQAPVQTSAAPLLGPLTRQPRPVVDREMRENLRLFASSPEIPPAMRAAYEQDADRARGDQVREYLRAGFTRRQPNLISQPSALPYAQAEEAAAGNKFDREMRATRLLGNLSKPVDPALSELRIAQAKNLRDLPDARARAAAAKAAEQERKAQLTRQMLARLKEVDPENPMLAGLAVEDLSDPAAQKLLEDYLQRGRQTTEFKRGMAKQKDAQSYGRAMDAERDARERAEGLPPGASVTPGARPSKTQKEAFAKARVEYSKATRSADRAEAILSNIGADDLANPSSPKVTELLGELTKLQIGVKTVAELGAISGPDMALIERVLKEPTRLGVLLTRPAFKKQLEVVRNWYRDNVEALGEGYGIKAPGAAPTRIRVRRKADGKTGSLEPADFNPDKYERL